MVEDDGICASPPRCVLGLNVEAMALLDMVGAVVGVAALGLGGWQLRVAILDRRDAHNGRAGDDRRTVTGGDGALPVSVPFGRLPVDVLGRDALLAELNTSLGGPWRRRRPRVWVLAGSGGMGKSTVALRLAAEARGRGWPVWWVNAADPLSLRGGVLEILRLVGAPDAVARAVRDGSPTAADRFWTFLDGAVKRAVLIFDNADQPTGLAADGVSLPGEGTGWVRPSRGVHIVVTTRTNDPRTWGSWARMRVLTALDDLSAADVLRRLAPRVDDPTGEEAAALAKRLGALPLALHLAGTYLASPFARWRSFDAYQQALNSTAMSEVIADLDSFVRTHGQPCPRPGSSRSTRSRLRGSGRHGVCCTCCPASLPPHRFRETSCGRRPTQTPASSPQPCAAWPTSG